MTTLTIIIVVVIGFILLRVQLGRERVASEAKKEQMRLQAARERLVNLINVRRKATELVVPYAQELARRRLELVRPDAYGIINWAPWQKELAHFTDNIVRPHLTSNEGRFIKVAKRTIEDITQTKAESLLATRSAENMSPREFELWCAETLSRMGWMARTTVATGDQGADVIASKGGITLVLQCKLYTSPVGNKAVQEAFAAQRHYGASASAVVTNATFTKAARDLAVSTGVLLLHYSSLAEMDSIAGSGVGGDASQRHA